jgi:hypothetical protein
MKNSFMYGDDEEMYNIENNEHPLSESKGEYLRETHSRYKEVYTESPISTKGISR